MKLFIFRLFPPADTGWGNIIFVTVIPKIGKVKVVRKSLMYKSDNRLPRDYVDRV